MNQKSVVGSVKVRSPVYWRIMRKQLNKKDLKKLSPQLARRH
jgi:hypothetical protein